MLLGFLVSKIPGLCKDRGDSLVLIQIAPTKTMGLAIPLIALMFSDMEFVGIYQLPALFYHPIQLTLGGIMTGPLRSWRMKDTMLNDEEIPLQNDETTCLLQENKDGAIIEEKK